MTAWFALILLQLVPLPPAIGLDLPGRSWAIAVQREISLADSWRPLSLAPDRTDHPAPHALGLLSAQ
jgi:hypothetical protein